MKPLTKIFDEAKNMENMGEGKLLIVMGGNPFIIFNAKILDPYFGALIVNLNDKDKVVNFTQAECLYYKADFVDNHN